MAAERRNVMVVGDDAQTIYSFRGAPFENILTFPLRFPDATIYKLETNYRSTPQILTLANDVDRAQPLAVPEGAARGARRRTRPRGGRRRDVFEQAAFVAQRILELRDEGENARRHRGALPLALPVAGAADGALAAADPVRDPRRRPLLRAGAHQGRARVPEDRHQPAGRAVVEAGAEALSESRREDSDRNVGTNRQGAGSTRCVLSAATQRRGAASIHARELLRLISGESMQHNPSESIRLIVERGYADYARSRFANAQARLDDLEQLSQYALRYEDVNEFLDEVALANPIAGEDMAVVGPEDEKIVLSSVHQAKGLEWRIVFVIWLADGRFPSQRALRVPAAS